MKSLFTVAIVMILATGAHAFDEPTEFRGLKFGESIKTQLPECDSVYRPLLERPICLDASHGLSVIKNLMIGKTILVDAFATEVDEKLASIYMETSSSNFNMLMDIFRERYGSPTQVQETTWTSKAGRTLPNTIVAWRGDNIHITATQLGATLNKSSIVITTKASRDRAAEKRKDNVKDAAKGL